MKIKDTRSLHSKAQEDLRIRVVYAVIKGKQKQNAAAKLFHVSAVSVNKWVQLYKKQGIAGLRANRKGRPPVSRLKGYEASMIVRLITDRCPDQLKLPFALWTREAVQQLIQRKLKMFFSIWTIGRYLKRWGFTPQKPIRRAYEKDMAKVEHWLKTEYPGIKKRAKQEKADIHWEDETGIRSDHQAGTTWGIKGKTPIVPCTGKRFGFNMVSSITNKGHLSFRLFKGSFTVDVFIDFLARLIKNSKRKIFLIMDGHPVHKAKKVRQWMEENKKRIECFLLPSYSPELNPDELLNQDLKSNALGRKRAKDITELKYNIRSFLIQRQRNPEIVQNYFLKESVIYAAA